MTDLYPSDWDACLDRVHDERGEDARPELVENVVNIDDYNVIFLGYLNWWYGVPMPLLTFLEEHDLSGKQVYLFCYHGTGGLANSVEIITEAIPNATISGNILIAMKKTHLRLKTIFKSGSVSWAFDHV